MLQKESLGIYNNSICLVEIPGLFYFFLFFLCSLFFPLSLSLVFYFTTVCRQTSASVLFTNLRNGCLGKGLKGKDKRKKNIGLGKEDVEEENMMGQEGRMRSESDI